MVRPVSQRSQALPRKRAYIGLAIGIVVVGAVFAIYWVTHKNVSSRTLQPNDQLVVERGTQLYVEHCASCHGVSLEGQSNWRTRGENGKLPAPPHDATGHTWHHRDELLFQITKEGTTSVAGNDYQSDMPAYAPILSDEEIIAVLSFIKSTWSAEIKQRHDEISGRVSTQQRQIAHENIVQTFQWWILIEINDRVLL